MKAIYKISKIRLLMAFLGLMVFYSCSEDYPGNIESSKTVELRSIKIVNAGAGGSEVVNGVINEDTKKVSFPRLDPETDFSNIKFEAELSDGSKLDKDSYTFGFAEGDSEKSVVIKVMNDPRFREYVVTLRLIMPVFGADFEKPKYADYTNNEIGNPVYPTFTSLLTRGSGFDGEHVLVVTRAAGGSHLLKVEDLFNNQINPLTLDQTGVSGGTFPVNVGAIVNGHTYVSTLSGGQVSPLKIYHWTDPNVAPDVIANINVASIPGAGDRHGDNMSVSLDENGNGFIFYGDNAGTKILRLKVTDYTTVSDPKVLGSQSGVGPYMTMTQVGQTEDYILTGHEAGIMVVKENGGLSYSLGKTSVPLRGVDARVVNFNGERYLIMTTAARTGSEATVFYVYDITKGNNTVEALSLFEEGDKKAVFEYSLLGPVNIAPSTQTGWHVKKDAEGNDESLVLYAATADAGFVLFEFPKSTLEED